MNMSLKDYLESNYRPKLSYHTNYCELFELQFYTLDGNLIAVYSESENINFYSHRDEFNNFVELSKNGLLLYKDKVIDSDDSSEFLRDYSIFFEKGFNSINNQTPASAIINYVPVCYPTRCLCKTPEPSGGIIGIGRSNSNSKPCISGKRPISLGSFFGHGLLRAKSIVPKTNNRVLALPNESAFQDGVMYKSIFEVVERYSEFSNYFEHPINNQPTLDFINKLLKGIEVLKKQDVKAECIRLIKNDGSNQEGPFRDWFVTFLNGIYNYVNSEPEKGNGRIDLKVEDEKLGTKIIEFKGWWNNDKNQVVTQIMSYLTDFERDGYIVMINHTKRKGIYEEYRSIIECPEMNYVPDSFIEKEFRDTGYKYFQTVHNDGIRSKLLTHFILNVY